MDAISNIIYWQGDPARGVNKTGVEFIRYMNRGLKERHPSAILCAEDSSSYPGVTVGTDDGGLGFDYKWDMGWMNDTLEYFRTAPQYRSRDYHKLTFSMHSITVTPSFSRCPTTKSYTAKPPSSRR